MNCEYCGTRVFEDSQSCPKCGAPLLYQKPWEFDVSRMPEHYYSWQMPQDEPRIPDPVPVNRVSYKRDFFPFPFVTLFTLVAAYALWHEGILFGGRLIVWVILFGFVVFVELDI